MAAVAQGITINNTINTTPDGSEARGVRQQGAKRIENKPLTREWQDTAIIPMSQILKGLTYDTTNKRGKRCTRTNPVKG